RLGRGVVPVIAGRLLIVPDIFAGVGVQRDDRGEIEVVAAGRAADLAIPRRAVAGADIDHVEVRIVGDGVPRRAAAAIEPVLAGGIPGLGRGLLRGILERFRGIAGHGEPAPELVAAVGVVGGDVAARAIFGAALADQHLAVVDARRAGDGVGMIVVDQRVLFPDLLAARRIERDQPSVIGGDEHLALPQRDAAIDHVAAALVALLAVDAGIEGPDFLARARVDRVHHAP